MKYIFLLVIILSLILMVGEADAKKDKDKKPKKKDIEPTPVKKKKSGSDFNEWLKRPTFGLDYNHNQKIPNGIVMDGVVSKVDNMWRTHGNTTSVDKLEMNIHSYHGLKEVRIFFNVDYEKTTMRSQDRMNFVFNYGEFVTIQQQGLITTNGFGLGLGKEMNSIIINLEGNTHGIIAINAMDNLGNAQWLFIHNINIED